MSQPHERYFQKTRLKITLLGSLSSGRWCTLVLKCNKNNYDWLLCLVPGGLYRMSLGLWTGWLNSLDTKVNAFVFNKLSVTVTVTVSYCWGAKWFYVSMTDCSVTCPCKCSVLDCWGLRCIINIILVYVMHEARSVSNNSCRGALHRLT
jgi:hypothetical protein